MASSSASASSAPSTNKDLDVLAYALTSASSTRGSVVVSGTVMDTDDLITPRQAAAGSCDSGSVSARSSASDGSVKATEEKPEDDSVSTAPFGPWPGPLSLGQTIHMGTVFNSVKYCIKDNFYTPFRCFIGGADSGGSFTWRHQGPTPMNYVQTSAATNYGGFPLYVVSWGVGGDDPSLPDAVYSRASDHEMVYMSYTNRPGEFTLWGMTDASAQDLAWRYDNLLIAGALKHNYYGSFIIWDITGIAKKVHPHIAGDWCMGSAWCPNPAHREVIVCSLDGHMFVLASPNTQWDFLVRYDIDVMAGPLWKCKYHPNGDYIYTVSGNGDIVCYWIRTAKPPHGHPWPPVVEIYRFNVGPVMILDMSVVEVNQHIRIALATSSGLMVFDEDTMSVITDLQIPGVVPGTYYVCRSVCWNYDGTEIVAGWGDLHIRVYSHGAWPPPPPPLGLTDEGVKSLKDSASAAAPGSAESDPLRLVD